MDELGITVKGKSIKYGVYGYALRSFLEGERRICYVAADSYMDSIRVRLALSNSLEQQGLSVVSIDVDRFLHDHMQRSRYHSAEYEAMHGPQIEPIANQAEADWVMYDLINLVYPGGQTPSDIFRFIFYGKQTPWIYQLPGVDDSMLYVTDRSSIWKRIKRYICIKFFGLDHFVEHFIHKITQYNAGIYDVYSYGDLVDSDDEEEEDDEDADE